MSTLTEASALAFAGVGMGVGIGVGVGVVTVVDGDIRVQLGQFLSQAPTKILTTAIMLATNILFI